MVAKCTGIIPIIPDLVSASGMKIGAVYKRVYGFTDLRGRPAGRGRARHGPPNQVTAGMYMSVGRRWKEVEEVHIALARDRPLD